MAAFEIEKVVAVCFLESTKSILQSLGAYRMELCQQGIDPPETLTQHYATVRRLRDYLQRCIGAYPKLVPLELEDDDANALVSCAARTLEVIDRDLSEGPTMSARDREWLEQKRDTLLDWAVEFATKRVTELPGPKPAAIPSTSLKKLTARVASKVAVPAASPGSTIVRGFYPGAPGAFGGAPGADDGASSAVLDPPSSAAAPAAGGGLMGGSEPVSENRLVDPRVVRDPRLRPLLAMDLKAFERAMAARDHRLALFHLASVVEIAALDHALLRREEFGLTGPPDQWDLKAVLEQALNGSTRFRPLLAQLDNAAHLARPARQLVRPTVVTAEVVDRVMQDVQRLFRELGFISGRGAGTPSGRTVRWEA